MSHEPIRRHPRCKAAHAQKRKGDVNYRGPFIASNEAGSFIGGACGIGTGLSTEKRKKNSTSRDPPPAAWGASARGVLLPPRTTAARGDLPVAAAPAAAVRGGGGSGGTGVAAAPLPAAGRPLSAGRRGGHPRRRGQRARRKRGGEALPSPSPLIPRSPLGRPLVHARRLGTPGGVHPSAVQGRRWLAGRVRRTGVCFSRGYLAEVPAAPRPAPPP